MSLFLMSPIYLTKDWDDSIKIQQLKKEREETQICVSQAALRQRDGHLKKNKRNEYEKKKGGSVRAKQRPKCHEAGGI